MNPKGILKEKDPIQLNGLYTPFVYFPSVSGSSTNLPRSRGTETPREGRSRKQLAFLAANVQCLKLKVVG